MQVNTMLCLDMSKCQFDMENLNVIRTNYHSSVEVKVLLPQGGRGGKGGGASACSLTSLLPGRDTSGHKKNFIASDWTKIQDGK